MHDAVRPPTSRPAARSELAERRDVGADALLGEEAQQRDVRERLRAVDDERLGRRPPVERAPLAQGLLAVDDERRAEVLRRARRRGTPPTVKRAVRDGRRAGNSASMRASEAAPYVAQEANAAAAAPASHGLSHERLFRTRDQTRGDARRYDPQAIEAKWQHVWEDGGPSRSRTRSPARRPEQDLRLEMLPYPSGELHMGHVLNYTIGDVVAHVRRRRGFAGAAADGLRRVRPARRERGDPRGRPPARVDRAQHRDDPEADQAAWAGRSTGRASSRRTSPSTTAGRSGSSCASTSAGLAYRKDAPVNWCPNDQTVLANEQVIDGRCERCGTEVEAREPEQWFFRITDYADRLLDDMELLESWPERVLTMQRNWIGRSRGRASPLPRRGTGEELPVFTTRPDTLFGATFFVLAPEHPLVERVAGTSRGEVPSTSRHARRSSAVEREAKEKDGVFTGRTRSTRSTASAIPIWVADYVLMDYGTGAIMAVPAHDERDFAFARALRPADRPVVGRADGDGRGGRLRRAHRERGAGQLRPVRRPARAGGEAGDRRLAGRARPRRGDGQLPAARLAALAPALLGLPDPDRPLRALRRGAGARDELPVLLPEVEDFLPKGRSPLAAAEDWVRRRRARVRRRGAPRDRHDGHVRRLVLVLPALHATRTTTTRRSTREVVDFWLPVNQYIGGIEHAILHLMYARFFTKALQTSASSASASRSPASSTRG